MTPELHALIVDDKEDIARLFSTMLESLPRVGSVRYCSALQEAVKIVNNNPINIIVLDLFLEESEGLSTLQAFKIAFPTTPVIVVTGFDQEGLSYKCFEAGAADYLAKPDVTPMLLYKSCVYAVERDIINKKGKQYKDTLRSLLGVAPIGIGMAVERRMVWVNDYMCEMLGYERSELEGKNSRVLYPSDEEYERVGKIKYPRVYEGEKGITETQWVCKDGSTLDILLGASAVGPGSPSAGVIFTALDFTKISKAKRKIRQERDKAQRYLDIAGTMILVIDLSGNIGLINQRGCEILGYDSSDELIGKNWFDTCILPEERERVFAVFQEVLSTKHVSDRNKRYENHVVRKDGDVRLISWNNSYVLDNCNLVTLSSGEDITDRRAVEIALKKSEEKYRTAIESAGEGILVVQDEVIKFVNKRISDIFGFKSEEMIGHTIGEFLHPDNYEEIADRHRKRMVGALLEPLVHQVKVVDKEGKIVDADLRVVTMEWEGRPAALGFIMDITDRVTLKERQNLIIGILKLLNEPYTGVETIESLLKLVQDFTGIEAIALRLQEGQDYPYFVYKGFEHRFISMENYLCSYYEDGECIIDDHGRPVLSCMCGCVIRGDTEPGLPFFTEGGSFWTNSTTDLLEGSGGSPARMRTRNKCNEEGYESVAIIPLPIGGEIIGSIQLNDRRKNKFTLSLIQFMEELALSIAVAVKRSWQEDRVKALEIAKTKDLLQSSRLLNSGIAHELRTPMQALLNSLELIKEEVTAYCEDCSKGGDCETKQSIIDLADDGLDRTEYSVKVLNSLSEYSKIASGSEVHLINVVPELKTIMRTLTFTDQFKSVAENGFELTCEGTSDGACFVSINRVDFSQLITNLCRNAREAIDHEEPEVRISVSEDAPNVKIVVTDNGRGIDSSLGDKIFEPYFSTKENPDGYNQGLGLAMVRDIISAYGGSISYNSKPGHTEFIVTLPCEHKE